MKSVICLLACVAYASAGAVLLNTAIEDDGQWRPWLDGSILGASPGLATAALGSADHALVASPLIAGHYLHKRSLGHYAAIGHAGVINPNALNVPLDTVHVAAAKNAQLISQATEGTRNILGGGIPLALPADTPEVAAGKAAHAIAHETQKAATASHGYAVAAAPVAAVAAAPVAAAVAAPAVVAARTAVAAPVAAVAAPVAYGAYAAPLAYSAPVAVTRITPATALTHDAQVVAPAVGHATVAGVVGTGVVGAGLVRSGLVGHGLLGHGLVARHW